MDEQHFLFLLPVERTEALVATVMSTEFLKGGPAVKTVKKRRVHQYNRTADRWMTDRPSDRPTD